jgi:hypothetical protein
MAEIALEPRRSYNRLGKVSDVGLVLEAFFGETIASFDASNIAKDILPVTR